MRETTESLEELMIYLRSDLGQHLLKAYHGKLSITELVSPLPEEISIVLKLRILVNLLDI